MSYMFIYVSLILWQYSKNPFTVIHSNVSGGNSRIRPDKYLS